MAGQIVTMPTLKLGSTGVYVNTLQGMLVKVGNFDPALWGKVDVNVFGPVTLDAVMRFQARVGIPKTGVVDDTTWTQLSVVSGAAKMVVAPAVANVLNTPHLPVVGGGGPTGPAYQPIARGPSVLPKLIVGLGVAAIAYFVYRRKFSSYADADGIASVDDDGEDNAGPAFRSDGPRGLARLAGSSRRRKPARRARQESSEREGTITVPEPRQTWGRNAWRTMRDEDSDEFEPVYPGKPPKVIRLEADEKMYKNQKQYREDMKQRAWERARANDTAVHVVARGTARALYRADPSKQ